MREIGVGGGAGRSRRAGATPAGLRRAFDIMLPEAKQERGVALYVRREGELEGLRAHCERRGLRVEQEFVEGDGSGVVGRSALARLRAAVRAGDVRAVAVSRLAGLASSLSELGKLSRELDQLRVPLHAFEDGIDTSRGGARDLSRLLACVESFERERQRQRTRAGLAAARERGRRLGRPPVPIPVDRAERMVADGVPVAEVARRLGVSRSSLRRALARHA